MALDIRAADTGDLNRLVEIYNHYVTKTHITFDTQPFVVTERIHWFNQFAASGPHRLLVATLDDAIIGYASSAMFKPRPAYSTSVETSVYLDSELAGNGYGTQLYTRLIDELVAEPTVHRAYGGIALPNAESIALHQKLGFVRVASYHEVGYKFDQYWDVDWFEKDVA